VPAVVMGPRCNRRVTCDPFPTNARSESAIAANPLNPLNMIGASKRFTNPSIYAFSLASYATFDGGQTWMESSLTLLPGWAGTSDPAVAWDNAGNAYLVALPFGPGTPTDYTGPIIGIAVYKSTNGGRTWGAPVLIHASIGDDKQWAAGDGNPASPYYGNVYAAWDDGSNLRFARSTDHGITWKGTGASPAGSILASDSFSPELSVAADGTIYIVWLGGGGTQIKFVKSTNGGNSFSASAVVASGITSIPSKLPGGIFRTFSLPTGCTGTGSKVVFAWADYREGVSRIYYRRSTNGGNNWHGPSSGEPLLSGGAVSGSAQHDFHPQLISTPNGEIGCAFYEFGPKGPGEFVPPLIHVILAVSTNDGASFPNRITVTDTAWDPTVDAPLAHGNPAITFIGDYFGLDASRLGFFPFWTDTRTGVQEIFVSRISVNPADVYIRDSSSDIGDVPSPGFHWEYPDLIVRRQPDGNVNFVNEDLLRDGVTNHYIYAKVTNRGPNKAHNVKLSITVGNWPNLQGLPGSEFRYPQDWYSGDWDTPYLQDNRLNLGENTGIDIPNGNTKIIGPIVWPAAQIPDPYGVHPWHPCLLAEVRTDNDDSAGGIYGCDIDADPDPCKFGSFFWGNNNVSQRNLTYATVIAATATLIQLPFIVGSIWSSSKFIEVIVNKGRELAYTPMILRMESIIVPGDKLPTECGISEIMFEENCKVVVRMGKCDVGEIIASKGTIWRPNCPPSKIETEEEVSYGSQKIDKEWHLNRPKGIVGFPIVPGEMKRMTLSFTTPLTLKPEDRPLIQIFQRNDHKVITGSVTLELKVTKGSRSIEKQKKVKAKKRKT